jgi:Spy/CpxP family protein refolding chaperone
MKSSKLSLAIIAAAGLLSLAPSIQAQTNTPGTPAPGRRGGAMNPEARLTAFETALGSTNKLTEAQKPKVKAVIEEQVKKVQEIQGQRDSLSQEDLRAKRTALTEETNKKMKEILNADQYKVWEQQAQRGRGARRQGGGGGGGAGGGQNN